MLMMKGCFLSLRRAIQKLKLNILLYYRTEISSQEEIRFSPEKVTKKFPELKIICAYMGCLLMCEEVLEKLVGKNIYLDTSDSIKIMGKELLEQFFENYSFDKIIYESNFSIRDSKEEIEFIKTLNISEKMNKKILF
jgi:predicted TIM-barrel fold metal-dependent hydrolase